MVTCSSTGDHPGFTVRLCAWPGDAGDLRLVREAVFVREQGVPVELEWDGLDETAVHALAVTGRGDPVGTGRLLPDGHIGRMAVLAAWRGRGVGGALLDALMDVARRRGDRLLILNAQTRATRFYARWGFRPEGPEFSEAGIPHRRMVRHEVPR